jgi:O-antigen/teichoic acid export membrane protein
MSARNLSSSISLRTNLLWTVAGKVVYAGCQWGMLLVLTRLGSPEMVGQFALGLAITAPIIMFANLNLREVLATDAKVEYSFADYLGLRLTTTALALLVIAGIVLVSDYDEQTALIILAIGVAKAFEATSDAFYGLLQQHERMDRIAKSNIAKGPLSLIALSVGVSLTGEVFWGVVGLMAVWASILFVYDIRNGRSILRAIPKSHGIVLDEIDQSTWLHRRSKVRTLATLAWLALPLGFVAMLDSLNFNIPRYFVEQQLGQYDLGVFAALTSLVAAGIVIVNALGQTSSPRLARHYADGDDMAFRGLLLRLLGISALAGGMGLLAATVAGEQILMLLFPPEYAQQDLFVWLMVAAALFYLASCLNYGMIAVRRLRIQILLFLSVTASTALACVFLVPSAGLLGAAASLAIGALVQLVGALVVVAHALRRNRDTAQQEGGYGRKRLTCSMLRRLGESDQH